jgi:hypothetical protein
VDLFPSSGQGRKTPTPLGSLERANLNHWKTPGRSHICEAGKPLTVRLREHSHPLKEGLLEKSKLAQNAYEEGHRTTVS